MGNTKGGMFGRDQPVAVKRIPVVPYRDGGVASSSQQSRIQSLMKSDRNKDIGKEDQVTKMKQNQQGVENIQEEIEKIEINFFQSPALIEHLREEFQLQSKQNKMGKKKLLQYFGLQELDNYKLGNRFFQCVKSTYSVEKTGPWLDYSKFVQTISMLSGNNYQGRLNFLYKMFDINLDGSLEKEELRGVLMMFLQAMLHVSDFQNPSLQQLQQELESAHEQHLEVALDEIVSDIFEQSQTQNGSMDFDKWREWIEKQEGFQEILMFDPHIKLKKQYNGLNDK